MLPGNPSIQQTDFFQVCMTHGKDRPDLFAKIIGIGHRLKIQQFNPGIGAVTTEPAKGNIQPVQGGSAHQSDDQPVRLARNTEELFDIMIHCCGYLLFFIN